MTVEQKVKAKWPDAYSFWFNDSEFVIWSCGDPNKEIILGRGLSHQQAWNDAA